MGMGMLIAEPSEAQVLQQTPELAPTAPPGEPSCSGCGGTLSVGQYWCLECGTAAKGRLGANSLRKASSVVGLTLLIGSGFVAASYAALSPSPRHAASPHQTLVANGSRAVSTSASASTQPSATASPPSPNPSLTPSTLSAAQVAAALAKKKAAIPVHTAAAAVSAVPATNATANTTSNYSPTYNSTPTYTHHTYVRQSQPIRPQSAGPVPIVLDTDAATVYNPNKLPDATFGDPSKAIDGDLTTAWTASLDSAGKLGAGLNIDLKTPQAVSSIKLITTTPGMTIQIYGAPGDLPALITDPSWVHLATVKSLKRRDLIKLKTRGEWFRQLDIWITQGVPAKTGSTSTPGSTGTTGATGAIGSPPTQGLTTGTGVTPPTPVPPAVGSGKVGLLEVTVYP